MSSIDVVHKIQMHMEHDNPIYVGTFADGVMAEKVHKQLQDLTDNYVSYTPIPLNHRPPLFLRFSVESDEYNTIYAHLDGVGFDPKIQSKLVYGHKDYGYKGEIFVPIVGSIKELEQEAIKVFTKLVQDHRSKENG